MSKFFTVNTKSIGTVHPSLKGYTSFYAVGCFERMFFLSIFVEIKNYHDIESSQ